MRASNTWFDPKWLEPKRLPERAGNHPERADSRRTHPERATTPSEQAACNHPERAGSRQPPRASRWQTTTPSEQTTTPSEQATTPSEQASTPSEQATTPSEQATTPSEQATTARAPPEHRLSTARAPPEHRPSTPTPKHSRPWAGDVFTEKHGLCYLSDVYFFGCQRHHGCATFPTGKTPLHGQLASGTCSGKLAEERPRQPL